MKFFGEMTMIRKIMLGAVLIGCSTGLYAADASTQTESMPQAKKSTTLQMVRGACSKGVKAVAHSAKFLYRRRNTKPARIGGHLLKIAGGTWAIVGTVKTMKSLRRNHENTIKAINTVHAQENGVSPCESIIAPKMFRYTPPAAGQSPTPKNFSMESISRPPYEAIFALSAYLIYDGCCGIYNELKPEKKKNDTARS